MVKHNKKINYLTDIIDRILRKIGIVIKKDIGKHKNKLGTLNYIGWGFVGLFIFLDVLSIIAMLYQINIIFQT